MKKVHSMKFVILSFVVVFVTLTIVMVHRCGTKNGIPERCSVALQSEQAGESREWLDACPASDGFVFPVGPPDAHGYYNAQGFGKNGHLGEDWNGTGGGNTDLGDPIHAIANGIVFYVNNPGPGWGNVVRIYHKIGTKDNPRFVESLYAHLKTVQVLEGDVVTKGQRLGSMGNVGGKYFAHLHLEMRTKIGMPIGGGYSQNRDGFTDPTKFIRSH